jgi:hypothetical protein
MSDQPSFEYARDDFRYPRWLERLLKLALERGHKLLESSGTTQERLTLIRRSVQGISAAFLIFGFYFWSAIFIGIWIFLDELHLQRFVDRSLAASRIRHFGDEALFPVFLTIHLWINGLWLTGLAALVGIFGMFLLSQLQTKHSLDTIQLPELYFLRWDRSGFLFLFIILGAWPGERSYLWPRLAAWFLPVLTFYDYIWLTIQLAKKRK